MFMPSNHSLQGLQDPPLPLGAVCEAIISLPAQAEQPHGVKLAARTYATKTHTHSFCYSYVDAYSLQDKQENESKEARRCLSP